MTCVSVMVVEDSPSARELITDALNSDPRIKVICAVDTAEKALKLLPRLAPDVVSMDIRLPGMDGIEATRRIMAEHPTPIVVVAADHRTETVDKSMEALRAGALTVIAKPAVESPHAYRAIARHLCEQFLNMSQVKVVRQRFTPEPVARRAVRPALRVAENADAEGRAVDLVAVVASTGGPAAVSRLLRSIGPDFPAPILLVQHMDGTFLGGYASWLASTSGLPVTLASERQEPKPGAVYLAPARHHLTFVNGRLRLVADAGTRGHVPSGDALFRSLALNPGPRALGVLLTGMGEDGARGLLEMRKAGAHTIAQDRTTCAVYGMPAVAVSLGAACEQLPIEAIAPRIVEVVRGELRAIPAIVR